jgi:hypothetical protein
MCEVQLVEHPPQVRVIDPHALQGGVQLMVTLGLGEPPQSLLLGQVVAFALTEVSRREILRTSPVGGASHSYAC